MVAVWITPVWFEDPAGLKMFLQLSFVLVCLIIRCIVLWGWVLV